MKRRHVLCLALAMLAAFFAWFVTSNANSPDHVNTAHLRAVHLGLLKYLQAPTHIMSWPQTPSGLNEKATAQWWIDQLAPFSVTADQWHDPKDTGALKDPYISYKVAAFGSIPNECFREDMPWVAATKPSISGKVLAIMADGTVKSQ